MKLQDPTTKIPLQSLVRIPDFFIVNLLNLLEGKPYSSSFFSKELGIDINLIEFIGILMKFQNKQSTISEK